MSPKVIAGYYYDPDQLHLVPESLRGPLQRFIENGVEPGSGVRAILANDLAAAAARLDADAIEGLPGTIQFLSCYAPTGCWGEPRKVMAWLARGGLYGRHRQSA